MEQRPDNSTRTMAIARKIFLQEVERGLPDAREALAKLAAAGYLPEPFEILYRFAHTLKGSGQMVRLRDIAEPAFELTTSLILLDKYDVELTTGLQLFLAERLTAIETELTRLKNESCPNVPVQPAPAINQNQPKTILLIDDDPAITTLVKDRLGQEGFQVTSCSDAISAEHYFMTQEPDLILLDIMLPGEDGITFCRRIRETNRTIPIIFFTAKGTLQDKLAGFAIGGDDYLPKPFEMEELVARIHAIMNRLELLQGYAWLDELTGVYNRRYLYHRMDEEIGRAQRLGSEFTIAMLDIDLFKNINDKYSHLAGDAVLKSFAALAKDTIRATDIIFRYGGDEFVAIFPESTVNTALLVLNRLRSRLAFQPLFSAGEGAAAPLTTISAGIAGYPLDGSTCEQLLQAADQAMYRAKAVGGNQIAVREE